MMKDLMITHYKALLTMFDECFKMGNVDKIIRWADNQFGNGSFCPCCKVYSEVATGRWDNCEGCPAKIDGLRCIHQDWYKEVLEYRKKKDWPGIREVLQKRYEWWKDEEKAEV